MNKIAILLVVVFVLAGGIVLWSMKEPLPTDDVPMGMSEGGDGKIPAEDRTGTGNETVLDLHGEGLTQVPRDVFTQTDLTELDLSENSLEGALPGEVRMLQKLQKLDLSDNQFTGVPAEIGQLKNLSILDLSNNKLTGLPNELGNLQNLTFLDLRGNVYAEADLANIKNALPSTTVIVTK